MLALLLAALAAAPVSPDGDETLFLRVGETRTLAVPDVARLLIRNPETLEATPLSKHALKLVGRSSGATTLTVWPSAGERRRYLVIVADPAEARAAAELRRLRVGETIRLPVPREFKVDVQHSEVASIEGASGERITVRAHAPGTATFEVTGTGSAPRTYRVEVVAPPAPPPAAPLCDDAGLPAPAAEAFKRALGLVSAKKHRESLPVLEEVLRLEPRASIAHLYLAIGHATTGDSLRGADGYRAFLAACPAHPHAENIRKILAAFEAQTAGAARE